MPLDERSAWSSFLCFGLKLSPEFLPRSAFVRIPPILRQPSIQDFPMPPWNGHILWMSRDDVPESLNIVHLFLN